MQKYIFLLLFFSVQLEARLIDKIAAVIDDEIVTQSMVARVSKNLNARRTISPQIYTKTNLNQNEIIQLFINRNLIRSKLSEMGYIINDDQVESQIKSTEKRLRLTRKDLLKFLSENNLSFEEYFEIIRETLEYNIFSSRVIEPLVSITEQEIKNTFFKQNSSNKTITFKYSLVDFSIAKNKVNSKMINNLPNVLKKYRQTGNLPSSYSTMDTDNIDDISEEDLSLRIKNLLKVTEEGAFSAPILLGNYYHSYFIKKKDIIQSSLFLEAKDRIYQNIFLKKAISVKDVWFQRELTKHYVKVL